MAVDPGTSVTLLPVLNYTYSVTETKSIMNLNVSILMPKTTVGQDQVLIT